MSIIQGTAKSGSASFYDFPIEQSLRFDGSSYLSRTFGIGTSATTRTFSVWLKRDSTSTNNVSIFGSAGTGFEESHIEFQNDVLWANERDSTDGIGDLQENSGVLFRDTSAWYHIVVLYDTRSSVTNDDRVKIFVNGTQVGTSTTIPVNNFSVQLFRSEVVGYIADNTASRTLFSGYLANIQFIDGQALDESYFGETKDDIWVPKAYTGSYGTNGFRLAFDSADFNWSGSSTMTDPYGSGTAVPIYGVADASGNGKHWVMNS
jgi:hypothetical protein